MLDESKTKSPARWAWRVLDLIFLSIFETLLNIAGVWLHCLRVKMDNHEVPFCTSFKRLFHSLPRLSIYDETESQYPLQGWWAWMSSAEYKIFEFSQTSTSKLEHNQEKELEVKRPTFQLTLHPPNNLELQLAHWNSRQTFEYDDQSPNPHTNPYNILFILHILVIIHHFSPKTRSFCFASWWRGTMVAWRRRIREMDCSLACG